MSPPDERKPLDQRKLLDILLKFKFFQELDSGVQQQLTSIVQHMSLDQGVVLFRQCDPPGNCYVLLSGEVGIFVKSEEELGFPDSRQGTPRQGNLTFNPALLQNLVDNMPGYGARRKSSVSSIGTSAADSHAPQGRLQLPFASPQRRGSMSANALALPVSPENGRRRSSVALGMPGAPAGYLRRRRSSVITSACADGDEVKIQRKQTKEGFSMYHENSEIGAQVATLTSGRLFGELALMNDQPRSASIKCLNDCQFLVIARKDFDRVLKEEMVRKKEEKIRFLKAHVPGMNDLPAPRGGRPHASYFFHKSTFLRGQQLLTQGVPAEDVVYIVAKGAVEFLHKDPEGAGTLAASPSSRPGSASRVARPSSGTPVRPGSASGVGGSGRAAPRPGTWPGTGRPEEAGAGTGVSRQRRVGVLVNGGCFGSLPTGDPEPFTVQVMSTSCEVHFVTRTDMARLPKRLVWSIQEYIVHSTTWRLNQCLESRAAVAHQALRIAARKLENHALLSNDAEFRDVLITLPVHVPPKGALLDCEAVSRGEGSGSEQGLLCKTRSTPIRRPLSALDLNTPVAGAAALAMKRSSSAGALLRQAAKRPISGKHLGAKKGLLHAVVAARESATYYPV